MITRISARGASFKGAGTYYLHDKGAQTTDRVAWTQTLNTYSDDPNKALKEMAWVSKNSNRIKQDYGGSMAGRKSSGKSVLAWALSWAPEQKPTREEQERAAYESLKVQGLEEHQAIITAHNDTPHSHVHVIVNLVNPMTGRTHTASMSKRKFSEWAEDYERRHGRIYCEQRVENNKKRRENPEHKINYKEKPVPAREQLAQAYQNSDNLKSFQAALKEQGYTLALGHRGRIVIIDEQGHTHNLVRQLEGIRTKDVEERFKGIRNETSLPKADQIRDQILQQKDQNQDRAPAPSEDRKQSAERPAEVFDRDQYEADFQKGIVDAAIKSEQEKKKPTKKVGESGTKQPSTGRISPPAQKSFAEDLDAQRRREAATDATRSRKEQEYRDFYGREEHLKRIEELRARINKTFFKSRKNRLQEELRNLQKSLEDMDRRMKEQGIDPQDPTKRDYEKNPVTEQDNQKPAPEHKPDQNDIEKRRQEFYRRTLEDLNRQSRDRERGRDHDQDRGMDFG